MGTGIGGGAMANGRLIYGQQHPEMGHIRIPHDRARDPFPELLSVPWRLPGGTRVRSGDDGPLGFATPTTRRRNIRRGRWRRTTWRWR